MSSGVAYPMPVYIPPLSIFNPLFFPQSFGTTTTGGGGGGFTNIFPGGLTSGNVITMDGGTGGAGGTGAERTITGLSQIEWVDYNSTNPTAITGYMKLIGNTLEIGSASNSTGINVNLQGTSITSNGVEIGGGNVSNDINNTFQSPATTQTFDSQNVIVNGGSVVLNTTASQYPITITNESTSATDNVLQFQPNPSLSAGQYIFQTYGSGYVDTAIIDYTGIELVNAPFKSSLNTTPSTLQLPTNYSCFYSNNQQPYFAYNNAGSVITQSLSTNNFSFTTNPGTNYTVGGVDKTQWTISTAGSVITIGDYGNAFNFDIVAGVLTQATISGAQQLDLNDTFSITTGIAIKQPYTTAGFIGFGYVFAPISTSGSSASMAIIATTGTYLGNVNTTYTFTLIGTYNTAPLTIYGVSI